MILKFGDFILEKMGVAESTLPYNQLIIDKSILYFNNFYNSKKADYKRIFNIPTSELKGIINLKSWPSFPVSKILLIVKYERMSSELFKSKYPTTSKIKSYQIFGACGVVVECEDPDHPDYSTIIEPINSRAPHSIYLKVDAGVLISDDFDYDRDIKAVELEIESLSAHEFNHAYESYKRYLGESENGFPLSVTYALDVNAQNVPEPIWSEWGSIVNGVYWSEPFEIRAIIQEAQPYTSKMSFEEMKKKSPSWNFMERMRKFSAISFKKEMIEVITKNSEENPEELLLKMKNGFADKLAEFAKEDDEVPTISPDKIKRMSLDQFLKEMEVRIHSGAEKIRRGIIRQYSRK
jgi:hypothetical protein